MSIKSQMQDRAVAMFESMAARARTPQEIEAIRQRLASQIQSGAIRPYIGVPLIEDLTKRLTQARQQMAQAAMGAPAARGGAPIAQQIMAQAQEPTGVDALPSNLPQSYAPGGLVAFEEGGKVERYQNQGLVSPENMTQEERDRAAILDAVRRGYAVATDVASLPARGIAGAFESAVTRPLRAVGVPLPYLPREFYGPAGDPTSMTPYYDVIRREDAAKELPAVAAPAAPAAPTRPATQADRLRGDPIDMQRVPTPFTPFTPFAMPDLKLATYNAPALPAGTDLNAIVSGAPEKAKTAFNQARDAEEKALRAMTEPGESAREARFTAREAALARDSAISRALNIIGVGFGVAGSKERTLAGALGNEGRQGIQALIQGEAANRVAKERLEDARDNFEQQKIAAKKGDRAAANAAGQRAADDSRAYTQLTLQAAQAGNADALQRYTAQQQAEQFRVGEQNRSALGLAGLNLNLAQLNQTGAYQNAQLNQTSAYQNALLAQNEKRIAASDRATQARYAQVRTTALNKFDTGPGMQLNMQLAKQYGENWRTGTDARSLQAQMLYRQQRQAYLIDALGIAEAMDGGGARSADALLGGSE
jgi:hypothetical protein